MGNATFMFVLALLVSACSSTPNPSDTGSDAAVNPVDAGGDANVTPPTDGTVAIDSGTDVATPTDTGAPTDAPLTDSGPPPNDVMTYPVCPASSTDGMCQLSDGRMSNINLPPGQAYDPWLRDAMGNPTNRNMVPASGTERMRMASTGEYPEYYVPCWNNLFNDDWGFVYLTGSQAGRTTNTTIMANMVGGMYQIDFGLMGYFVWSVRNGQGAFWENFGRVSVAGAVYCQALMPSSCSQMNIACWSSPANPLTTPSTPPDITIRGRWSGDHVGP